MPAKVVKVTGLPSDATEESLADFFSFHGKILRTRVVGESGWLEFSTASEAKSSLLFDRTTFLGAKLRVSESDVDWSELPEDDGNESPPSRSEASSESYDVVERPPAHPSPRQQVLHVDLDLLHGPLQGVDAAAEQPVPVGPVRSGRRIL